MASFGCISEFNPAVESWSEYAERLKQFFIANVIEDENRKRAVFLTVVGPTTYGLLRNLLSLAKDVWSAGCVLVELILCRAIFVSDNRVSQLVEIMKVLGTPSKDEIRHMNRVYAEYSYPHLDPRPWQEIFNGKASPEAIDLVSRLLVYTPSARITPLQACAHKFFNKLREPGAKLLGKDLPPLFNFSEHELKIQPNLNSILIPPHLKDNLRSTNDDVGRVVAKASSSTTNNVATSEIQSKAL